VVVEGIGDGPGQADASVELADGQQPGSLESWPGEGSITSGVPSATTGAWRAVSLSCSGTICGVF
jgi:hypothetical protein